MKAGDCLPFPLTDVLESLEANVGSMLKLKLKSLLSAASVRSKSGNGLGM